MKYSSALVLLLLCFSFTQAQTFTNTTGGVILDPPAIENFTVAVSGLPAVIDSASFGAVSICWNINHTYDSDLDIRLVAPNGAVVELCNNHGGSSNNFVNTCVAENATSGMISNGVAPFSGTYYPDQTINVVNNGQNPNGTWTLRVLDEAPLDTGHLINWSITFANNPPPSYTGGPCTTTNAFGCLCPDGTTNCDLLPDMTNSATYLASDWHEYSGHIREGIATPNIGYGPMELHGTGQCFCDTTPVSCLSTCPDGSSPKELVNQTIYHKNGPTMTTYTVPAGTMTYHPTHGHIHVDDWTYNTLRIRGVGSDPRTWPIIGEGSKQSFCLINLGTCTAANKTCTTNGTAGLVYSQSTMPNGGLGSVTGCGEDQGIYVGNYDVYSSGLDGQEIDFGNICNGQYYIVAITDPNNVVREMNDDNNTAIVQVNLTQQQGNCCHTNFYADTTHGEVPFEVQFADSTVPIANMWRWDFGDGSPHSMDQFPQHVYTQPGVYTVRLRTRTSTLCTDSATRTGYIIVDPQRAGETHQVNTDPAFTIKAQPNPFNGSTEIHYSFNKPLYVKLAVTDLAGNTIEVLQDSYQHSGDHTIMFDAAQRGLANGFYLLHVVAGEKQYFLKLICQ